MLCGTHDAISHVDELRGGWPCPQSLKRFGSHQEALDIAEHMLLAMRCLFNPIKAVRALRENYHPDGFLRDMLAFTGTLRTFQGVEEIAHHLPVLLRRSGAIAASISLIKERTSLMPLPMGITVIRAPFVFQSSNPDATCLCVVKLVKLTSAKIKIFTMSTSIQELACFPSKPLNEVKAYDRADRVPSMLDCIVIGSGAGGLAVGAHLQSMGVNYAIVGRDRQAGDSWSSVYRNAKLHTVKAYSGLPFEPIPENMPQYLSAEQLGEYHREYAAKCKLSIFGQRTVISAKWTQRTRCWHIVIARPSGEERIRARNVVYAGGIYSSRPKVPLLLNETLFSGRVLHSSSFTSAKELEWTSKRVVIVGSATTAFDIALEASQAGCKVAIIQRSPVRLYTQAQIEAFQTVTHNENMPTEMSDMLIQEDPTVLAAQITAAGLKLHKETQDPEYYTRLRQAGLKIITDGPIQQQLLVKGGSHYIDVGCCEAITNGQIKVISDEEVIAYTASGLQFANGSEIQCDFVCFCTGYDTDVRSQLKGMIGSEEAERLEPVWGVNREGEVRGVWKQCSTSNPHIWITGGDLGLNRFWARVVALQVAAEVAGVRPPPYIAPAEVVEAEESGNVKQSQPILHL